MVIIFSGKLSIENIHFWDKLVSNNDPLQIRNRFMKNKLGF